MPEDTRPMIVAAIGNTRLRMGLWSGGEVTDAISMPHAEFSGSLDRMGPAAADAALCALATVDREAEERFTASFRNANPGVDILRIGVDLPIPLTHNLEDASTLGRDRALSALAAYSRAQQACAVVDVGTAVTVDFVDGEGTFHGGLIAPGVRMMLAALHEHTDALPKLDPAEPDPAKGPFGKDTAQAMQLGVRTAVAGLVRTGVERFADHYDAWPQVIATGGDAAILESEGIIEHFVPDLQLLGIGLCVDRAAASARDGADD